MVLVDLFWLHVARKGFFFRSWNFNNLGTKLLVLCQCMTISFSLLILQMLQISFSNLQDPELAFIQHCINITIGNLLLFEPFIINLLFLKAFECLRRAYYFIPPLLYNLGLPPTTEVNPNKNLPAILITNQFSNRFTHRVHLCASNQLDVFTITTLRSDFRKCGGRLKQQPSIYFPQFKRAFHL